MSLDAYADQPAYDVTHLPALSYAEARDLTSDLREHLAISGALLLEAYERQAWRTLGYATWADYVKRELASALSSVQRRLDHARLIKALTQMGVSPQAIPSVPLRWAGDALHHMPSIEAASEPLDELESILTGLRAQRLEALSTDEMNAAMTRLQPSIERAAERVGLTPTAFFERAVISATQIVGVD